MVSFHQPSQRFAVGTVESNILVYDLRTATKMRVLEGTEGAVFVWLFFSLLLLHNIIVKVINTDGAQHYFFN